MTNREFAERAKQIAQDYKTAYMLGGWGLPATAQNITRLINQYPKNEQYRASAENVLNSGFLFDCCGLVKGILWDWKADMQDSNGGGVYKSNGVPDVNEYGLLQECADVTSDFKSIMAGEYLWTDGHCGIYIGDGLAVEATPAFCGGVQLTAVGNLGGKQGYDTRTWKKHGKLPYITYNEELEAAIEQSVDVNITLKELAEGSCGDMVRSLQQLLIAKGFSCGACGDDGEFGPDTKAAVVKYQSANAASCGEADGIAGIKTWSSIMGVR